MPDKIQFGNGESSRLALNNDDVSKSDVKFN